MGIRSMVGICIKGPKDKWGLDGKCISYCYEYPQSDDDTLIINNGNDLPYPLLSITILMN